MILEATVAKPKPGEDPPWDKKLGDPWWTTIHTLAGVVFGLWLAPFLLVAALTIGWEVVEISVPGSGDKEINGNRMVDNLVAWGGWLIAGGIASEIAKGCLRSCGLAALGHPAGVDVDDPVDAHGVEQATVVGDEHERATEAVDGLLELLDRLEVEVVGGLVEHEHVDAPDLEHGQRGPGALARGHARRAAGPRARR